MTSSAIKQSELLGKNLGKVFPGISASGQRTIPKSQEVGEATRKSLPVSSPTISPKTEAKIGVIHHSIPAKGFFR